MKKFFQKRNGITLIALIITIIVLLILAGVSINAVIGDNGVLTQAQKASEKTNEAKIEEQRQMSIAEAAMSFENREYIDKNGDKAIIPAGFAVSQVEGENVIEDGLVVIDSKGNEFVWIPVKSEIDYVKKIGTDNYNLGDDDESDINKLISGDDLGTTSILDKYIGHEINQPEKDVVVKAGGFYVGRYEAGVELNQEIKWEENNWGENFEIVVKKGVQPARGLGYIHVRDLANKWKIESDVQSGLITGTQWDVMCNFIGWNIANENCGTWGNFVGTESLTYSGYCSNKNSMDWFKVTDVIKNKDIDFCVFPTGTFLTKYGLNTAKKIYMI